MDAIERKVHTESIKLSCNSAKDKLIEAEYQAARNRRDPRGEQPEYNH